MSAVLRSIMLRADDVGAYLWQHAGHSDRAAICGAAKISDAAALLEWYELGASERIPLISHIIDTIETTASILRARARETANTQEQATCQK